MKQDSDILDKIGRDPGFKVPEGYFENFARQMADNLPDREFKKEPRPTRWMRLRPFVYMAAMFAGVWLMMQIFSDMKNAGRNDAFNPEIAKAMADEKFVDDYMMFGDISDYDLMNEMYNEGVESNIFEADTTNVQ